MSDTSSYFFELAGGLRDKLRGGEEILASLAGEDSDFVRFNRGAVRQAGSVWQQFLTLDLIEGARHAVGTVALSGRGEEDRERLGRLLGELRDLRSQLPEDPHLLYSTGGDSWQRREAELPDGCAVVGEVVRAGQGADLVGIYAAGRSVAGFASSFGQQNWYETASFHLDWSLHSGAGRAVKATYAGFEWRSAELEGRMRRATEELAALGRRPRTIRPGRYRVYLTPAAVYELFTLLGWGAFGFSAHRSKATPLLRMVEEGAGLHPAVRLTENIRDGIAPNFQEAGFLRPDEVVLIEEGRYRDCLVSPRSAREYAVDSNGASASETPCALDLAAGELPQEDVIGQLHTGLYVGNLWYLNFSDRAACRMTGMTRFATFWVERGLIEAPLPPMRFDETLYRMLGANLLGLTRERELIFDPGTYGKRSTDSARLPGALIEDFALTL